MKDKLIGITIVVVALALGIGGAYGVSRFLPSPTIITKIHSEQLLPNREEKFPDSMMGRQGRGSEMQGYGSIDNVPSNAVRLTIDEAQSKAEDFAATTGKNLKVVEVMEFSNNFYAVVIETDTQKAAFELLVDPYTGQVAQEMGVGMMWNLKYGRMSTSSNPSATNTLSMTDAAANAQTVLDSQVAGAKVMTDGFDFYGYYSFDYEVNGKVAGMLSVNGETGQVFLHFWHATFISEKEF